MVLILSIDTHRQKQASLYLKINQLDKGYVYDGIGNLACWSVQGWEKPHTIYY